jgi:hypothetical protein
MGRPHRLTGACTVGGVAMPYGCGAAVAGSRPLRRRGSYYALSSGSTVPHLRQMTPGLVRPFWVTSVSRQSCSSGLQTGMAATSSRVCPSGRDQPGCLLALRLLGNYGV